MPRRGKLFSTWDRANGSQWGGVVDVKAISISGTSTNIRQEGLGSSNRWHSAGIRLAA